MHKSRLGTVVICGITSQAKRGNALGNVLLEPGEANLPKQSVVNVSQLYTVDKEDLIEKIGTLSPDRVQEILDGLYLLLEPRDLPEPHE